MRKRRYGLTAVAAPLGAAGAAKRAKRCTPLCRKGEGECGGCADSFGNVRPLLQLYVENYFAWWDSVQAGRRQEPLVPGRAVRWRGRAYRFQRFRTVTGDVAQCMLYDEATETFAKRVQRLGALPSDRAHWAPPPRNPCPRSPPPHPPPLRRAVLLSIAHTRGRRPAFAAAFTIRQRTPASDT